VSNFRKFCLIMAGFVLGQVSIGLITEGPTGWYLLGGFFGAAGLFFNWKDRP
jgi:hypothetical protein